MSLNNYSRILKSSSVIGGGQGVTLLIGMVNTKVAAVLIGPIGMGLLSLYGVIQGLASILTGLGIGGSGVRDVADAWDSNDPKRVGRIVLTLKRMSWLCGIAGACTLVLLAPLISQWAFDSSEHVTQIRLLAFSLLFGNLAAAETAIIRGARRIGTLTQMSILGAAIGCLIAIGCYLSAGIKGIVPAILLASFMSWFVAWLFARRIPVQHEHMTWMESFRAAGGLIRLGIAMMWTSLLATAVGLITNSLINQQIDIIAVGIYAAAFNLSGKFVNFILGAMAADYYPSLSAVQHDHQRMRILVNQQSEIGLLLAIPGLSATITLAPLIVHTFYTADFAPAIPLLQWFVLGCLGRVISWPMGFVILAKGKAALFAATETAFNALHAALILAGLILFNLQGVAYAFALLYLLYSFIMLIVCHRLINFRWSPAVLRLIGLAITTAALALLIGSHMETLPAAVLGILLSSALAMVSIKQLCGLLGPQHRVNQLLSKLPLASRLAATDCA